MLRSRVYVEKFIDMFIQQWELTHTERQRDGEGGFCMALD